MVRILRSFTLLRRLESFVLADSHVQKKRLLLWFLLLGLVAYNGLGSDFYLPPGHLDYAFSPTSFDHAPFSLIAPVTHEVSHGRGYLFRSYLGWVPINGALEDHVPWEKRSLSGVWNADGTLTVHEEIRHSRRRLKTYVSLGAALVLGAVFILRYARASKP